MPKEQKTDVKKIRLNKLPFILCTALSAISLVLGIYFFLSYDILAQTPIQEKFTNSSSEEISFADTPTVQEKSTTSLNSAMDITSKPLSEGNSAIIEIIINEKIDNSLGLFREWFYDVKEEIRSNFQTLLILFIAMATLLPIGFTITLHHREKYMDKMQTHREKHMDKMQSHLQKEIDQFLADAKNKMDELKAMCINAESTKDEAETIYKKAQATIKSTQEECENQIKSLIGNGKNKIDGMVKEGQKQIKTLVAVAEEKQAKKDFVDSSVYDIKKLVFEKVLEKIKPIAQAEAKRVSPEGDKQAEEKPKQVTKKDEELIRVGAKYYDEEDYEKAKEAFEKLEKKDLRVQHALGVIYLKGEIEGGKNFGLAKYYFEEAANQGHPGSQFNLANMYEQGLGVEVDSSEAKKWYKKAAELGLPEAQGNLGNMYARGLDGKPDYGKAKHWYEKAADQANESLSAAANARCNLGTMYELGFGVDKNIDRAREYYKQAASLGHAGAIAKLKYLE